MNVSKTEQRVLHTLAQGGKITFEKDDRGKIEEITCFTREGYIFTACSMAVFLKLRKRKLIRSRNGGPYRITREGLKAVSSRPDNR